MNKLRSLTLGALTLVTLATAVGCGQAGPTASIARGFDGAQAQGKGEFNRVLDFDMARYKKKLAKKAKKTRMPRQALLPTRVDLREHCPPVYDQGSLGACTAFAMGKGMRETMQRRYEERVEPLSAMFLYYEERKLMGTVWQDSGATITDGMTVMKKTGVAPEDTWRYDSPLQIIKFRLKPSKAAYEAAGEFKIKEAHQIDTVDDMRAALAQGHTVAFGYMVFDSFTGIGKDGKMPMPTPGERVMGGHAVLAVGYDDQKRHLIVRNSWSDKWGDKGYFYMPYDFAANRDYTDDIWFGK